MPRFLHSFWLLGVTLMLLAPAAKQSRDQAVTDWTESKISVVVSTVGGCGIDISTLKD